MIKTEVINTRLIWVYVQAEIKRKVSLKVVSIVQARVNRTKCWSNGRGYGGVGLGYAWV